jgi:hypothetical protein
MIINKNSLKVLLNNIKSFIRTKCSSQIDVVVRQSECINIRCYDDKCRVIDFFKYEKKGSSMLYKDNKYINRTRVK